jgi:hypothetical protein
VSTFGDLLSALKEALAAMEEEEENQERCVFGLGCGNCDAGVPLPHSMGCRIRNAIFRAERDGDALATAARQALDAMDDGGGIAIDQARAELRAVLGRTA